MKKIIMSLVVMLVIFLSSVSFAQVPCQGNGCNQTNMKNQIDVDHSQVLYYNNNSRSSNWAYPHSPHQVRIPQYYIQAPKGPKYQPLLNVVQFHMQYDMKQLRLMLKGENLIFNADVELDVTPLVEKIKDDDRNKTYVIHVLFPVKGVKLPKARLLAQISGRADDEDDATSLQVFAAICLKALEYGANAVYLTGEGTERVLSASGWGVGGSHVYASVNENGGNGNTSSGGAGYSSGSTKYLDQPYIQVNAVRANVASMYARDAKIKKLWNQNVKLEAINQQLEIRKNGEELMRYNQASETVKKSMKGRVQK